ncbi:MAG TPA: DUF928 domain-containing protein [Myxococcota bacterium]|jgi:hypothetical protein|nr:DUF928 domain-containing protein [Myxococcota bacterium]
MMRTTSVPSSRAALVALLVLLVASPGAAQREDALPADTELRAPATSSQIDAARRSREERSKPVIWRPTRVGSPKSGRVAGGVRGARALPKPLVLAPEHALTQSASPSLFWHLDGAPPETARIVFTLAVADAIEPLVERELPLPAAAGIQRIRLADFGILLAPEVDYAWSVSLLTGDDRSADLVSEGTVRLVGNDLLGGRPASARVFAEQGLWYDALEALSDALDATPSDPELRAQRDSLLRQAGLEPALSERPQAAH